VLGGAHEEFRSRRARGWGWEIEGGALAGIFRFDYNARLTARAFISRPLIEK
jgi:hypothetical protein